MSVRLLVFYEGLQDILVCRMLEDLIGRDAVCRMIDDEAGCELKFDSFPRNSDYIIELRNKMTAIIAAQTSSEQ